MSRVVHQPMGLEMFEMQLVQSKVFLQILTSLGCLELGYPAANDEAKMP